MNKNSKQLKPLKHASLIDVVAPGFGCSEIDLQKGTQWLEALGFKVRMPRDIFGLDLLHSNRDEVRAKHLIQALTKKDSTAIWFLRGGYGTNRLLPYLKKIKKPTPKILIGLSDLTSLHSYAIQNWGWPVFHGPHLDRIGKGIVPDHVLSETLDVLTGKIPQVEFLGLKPLNQLALKKGKIKAQIVGGNLKVIEGHVGTPDALSFQNRIVMLEEIGERAYRVDRMLFHLEQSKSFKKCKAVIFGQFIQDFEPGTAQSKNPELLEKWAEQQNFAVFSGLPCGHDIEQRILPLGGAATLELGNIGVLTCPTGVALCD